MREKSAHRFFEIRRSLRFQAGRQSAPFVVGELQAAFPDRQMMIPTRQTAFRLGRQIEILMPDMIGRKATAARLKMQPERRRTRACGIAHHQFVHAVRFDDGIEAPGFGNAVMIARIDQQAKAQAEISRPAAGKIGPVGR